MNLRIVAFVTASTLAHGAAALWFTMNPTPPQLALGGEARALRVALLSAPPSTDQNAPETRSVQTRPPANNPIGIDTRELQPAVAPDRHVTKQTPGPNAHELQHIDRTTHVQIAETNPQPVPVTGPAASNHNAATPQHSATKNISKHISAALRNQLAEHFVYPWLARQRGWQGRVLLSLHVASNGDLSDWKVVGTSGYRTLDQSALKAARRIEHLPRAEHWLNGGSLEVRLPVQYKLLDS